MSISLNNHENRIKALENKGFRITKLTSSPVFLTRSWKNICNLTGFKLMYILFDDGYRGEVYSKDGTNSHMMISLDALKQAHVANKLVIGQYASSEYTLLKIDSSNMLSGWSTQAGANPSDNTIQIWGLNLYYKFSNLIKEVLGLWVSL